MGGSHRDGGSRGISAIREWWVFLISWAGRLFFGFEALSLLCWRRRRKLICRCE